MKRTKIQKKTQRKSSTVIFRLALVTLLVLLSLAGLSVGIYLSTEQKLPGLPQIARARCIRADTEASCPPNWQSSVETLIGQPLLFSDPEQMLQASLANQGAVVATYNRVWPDEIAVTVSPLPLLYQIQTPTMLIGVLEDRTTVPVETTQEQYLRVHTTDNLLDTNQPPIWLNTAIAAMLTFTQTPEGAQVTETAMDIRLISPVELRLKANESSLEYIVDPQEMPKNLARLHQFLGSNSSEYLSTISGELDMRLQLPVLRRIP